MRIGVPRQAAPERRVAVTPEIAKRLVERGHVVVVETGAGVEAGHEDEAFRSVGAEVAGPEQAWTCDLVATVEQWDADRLGDGTALIGLLHPFDEPRRIRDLAARRVTAFAFEAVPRTTRAQTIDALSSQATVAGYRAVIEAAAVADRFFPMLTTAAGTIPPARVVVLGAGVAGLQAIATARRLGAAVAAFDVRAAAAEQVRSLGAGFIEVGIEAQDAAVTGGYAREVEQDEQARIMAGLAPHVERADAVLCTAAIPGRPAPRLVSKEMVEAMRRGSVVVDLAAPTGGNCELTVPGKTVRHGGVTIVGDTDLVSRVPGDASRMYARNLAGFVDLVAGEGGDFAPDWSNEVVAAACVTRDGEVVHPMVLESLERSGG